MSKSKVVQLSELQIVPSSKVALHIVNSTDLDLDPIARKIEESLESIYQNQINQSNQPVNEKASRKQK